MAAAASREGSSSRGGGGGGGDSSSLTTSFVGLVLDLLVTDGALVACCSGGGGRDEEEALEALALLLRRLGWVSGQSRYQGMVVEGRIISCAGEQKIAQGEVSSQAAMDTGALIPLATTTASCSLLDLLQRLQLGLGCLLLLQLVLALLIQ